MSGSTETCCNIYVDASGDDGFGPKASKTFTVALVVERSQDSGHNAEMFIKAKRLLGCRPKDEVKYRTIKRHPKRAQVWDCLKQLRIRVKAYPTVKETKGAMESAVLNVSRHAFWVMSAVEYAVDELGMDSARVFIDGSLPGLQKSIKQFTEEQLKAKGYGERLIGISFVQSRRIHMVQAADVFAGAVAEFVEANMGRFTRDCTHCPAKLYTERIRGKCRPHKLRKKMQRFDILENMEPLLVRSGHNVVPDGIMPPGAEWGFINCALRG